MTIRNPFDARGPTDPRHYANRTELLEFFKKNVKACAAFRSNRPDNIAIIGDWGIGKTSSLYKFDDILYTELKNEVNALSVIIPIKPSCCSDANTFAAYLLDSLSKKFNATNNVFGKAKNIIEEEARIWEKWKVTLSLTPQIERKEKQINAVSLTEELLKLWKKLEKNGFNLVLIMLDDIHYFLTEGWNGSLYDLRTDIQYLNSQGAKFIFVITGPKSVFPEMQEAAEPFTRLFERFELGNFDLKGTKELIKKPLSHDNIGISITEDVISKIYEITEGHPFFITLIMRDLLFEVKNKRIDIKIFNKLYPKISLHLAKTRFDSDFERATDAETEILKKIARFKNGEASLSEIKQKAASKLVERLSEKGLITKISRGKYKIYHPLFKEYILAQSQ